jgi:RNA polymerase sigma factor (TIGR02999 family)
MSHDPRGDITDLLSQFRRGPHQADTQLVALVYGELHRLAVRYMQKERGDHSLQPTALVHEAYLRLTKQRQKVWKNRAHFFAVAALLMRQILVDSARRRLAVKRGDGKQHVSLDAAREDFVRPPTLDPLQSEDILALDEGLTALAAIDVRRSRIVELRFFAGMTTKEIAQTLGISERTVEREWAVAQSWLFARMRPLS